MRRVPSKLRPDELDLLAVVDPFRGSDEVIAAWRRWAGAVDLDHVDAGAFELLPRVQRRLEDLEGEDSDYRIPGVYRFSWARNQVHITAATDIGGELEGSGIRACAINGTWVGFDGSSDRGARPLREAALLVDPAAAGDAVAVLRRSGRAIEPAEAEGQLGLTGSIAIAAANGVAGSVRLWCRLPVQILGATRLLARSRAAPALAPVAIPARDDRLIELCLEGTAGPPHRRLGWIADAGELLADGEVDWQELLRSARERRIEAHVAAALQRLAAQYPARVPEAIVRVLGGGGSVRFERTALWARSREAGAVRALALGWDQYRRCRLLGPDDPLVRPGPLKSLRRRHRVD